MLRETYIRLRTNAKPCNNVLRVRNITGRSSVCNMLRETHIRVRDSACNNMLRETHITMRGGVCNVLREHNIFIHRKRYLTHIGAYMEWDIHIFYFIHQRLCTMDSKCQ